MYNQILNLNALLLSLNSTQTSTGIYIYIYIYICMYIYVYIQTCLQRTPAVPKKSIHITRCTLYAVFGLFGQKKTTEIKMEDFFSNK